jgi:hypothetical protein
MERLRECKVSVSWLTWWGAKRVKFYKKISLFCDLNSIYSDINLKLWNIKENNIFFDIPK